MGGAQVALVTFAFVHQRLAVPRSAGAAIGGPDRVGKPSAAIGRFRPVAEAGGNRTHRSGVQPGAERL